MTRQYWWELRACDYYEEFEKPKIVWPETSLDNQFCFVEPFIMLNKTSFFIPSEDHVLLAILNSRLSRFYLDSIVSKMRGGYYSLSKAYVETIGISVSNKTSSPIEKYVQNILNLKKDNPSVDTSVLESQIDQLVYELYGLTEEEIQIIEASVK